MAAEGNGYIKLYRSILDWEWYGDWKTKTLFLHLLLTVNHKEKSWQGQRIQRGQRVCSLAKLSAETGLSMQSIRTCLKRLNATGEITSCGGAKNTVITVNNYEKYQQPTSEVTNNLTNCQQAANMLPTNNQQQLKNEKNDKNVKNEKKYIDLPTEDLCKNREGFYAEVARLYNEICQSYPRLTKLSEARKKAIAARQNSGYTLADFRRLFELAEASRFLKGGNPRNWQATFDWLLKDANMAKVLDGNYTDKGRPEAPKPRGGSDDFLANLAKALEADGHG